MCSITRGLKLIRSSDDAQRVTQQGSGVCSVTSDSVQDANRTRRALAKASWVHDKRALLASGLEADTVSAPALLIRRRRGRARWGGGRAGAWAAAPR